MLKSRFRSSLLRQVNSPPFKSKSTDLLYLLKLKYSSGTHTCLILRPTKTCFLLDWSLIGRTKQLLFKMTIFVGLESQLRSKKKFEVNKSWLKQAQILMHTNFPKHHPKFKSLTIFQRRLVFIIAISNP